MKRLKVESSTLKVKAKELKVEAATAPRRTGVEGQKSGAVNSAPTNTEKQITETLKEPITEAPLFY